MSGLVRPTRVRGNAAGILAGAAVRGPAQWGPAALTTNWILGRGAQLVPGYAPVPTGGTALTSDTEYTFQYRLRPRYQALERIWCFLVRTAGTSGDEVRFECPSGGTAVFGSASPYHGTGVIAQVTETLSAQSDAEVTATIAITPRDENAYVDHISCFEVPRAYLTESATNDRGTDHIKLQQGQPIIYANAQPMIDAVSDVAVIGRRASHLQWSVPVTAGGSTTTTWASTTISTAAGGVDIWPLGHPILLRKTTLSGTTGSLNAKFLCWCAGGGTGAQVRITSSVNGSSSWIDVAAGTTSPTWTTVTTVTCDCESVAASDGLQSSTYDTLNVQIRSKDGTTRIYCAAVSAYET